MVFERESKEFQGVSIYDPETNVPIESFQLCIKKGWNRPTPSDWVEPQNYKGEKGIFIDGLTPGTYTIWAKHDNGVERIYLPLGEIGVG